MNLSSFLDNEELNKMEIDASENHTCILTSVQTENCTHKLWEHSTPNYVCRITMSSYYISVVRLFRLELFTRTNDLATFNRGRSWRIRFND